MKNILFLILISAALSGCVKYEKYTPPKTLPESEKEIVSTPAFPVDEYEGLAKKGTGVVKGEVFAVTRGGDVKIGAGVNVTLQPNTSYTRARTSTLASINWRTQKIADADPRVQKYIISTKADSQGKFEFTNVPPGDYTLTGRVHWYAGNSPQFGGIHQRVIVKNGETITVMSEN
ncbi:MULTISPECIES: hypothetical protein [Providencia]|uniref:hypothetical protein n=1 Tax=Providencia TaxID=586 RepID=UPI0019CFF3A0|nr:MULTISPECIES: hypothetical protein [Providencia]MBN6365546.1 hypothetical protein [Providencia rettgeri]